MMTTHTTRVTVAFSSSRARLSDGARRALRRVASTRRAPVVSDDIILTPHHASTRHAPVGSGDVFLTSHCAALPPPSATLSPTTK